MGLVATLLAAGGWSIGLRVMLSVIDGFDAAVAELSDNMHVDSGYIEARERVETRGAARQP